MQTLPSGIGALPEHNSFQPLFLNMALETLLTQLTPRTSSPSPDETIRAITECNGGPKNAGRVLAGLRVRCVTQPDDPAPETMSFATFLSTYRENDPASYFLDVADSLIQVRSSKITFENEAAQLVIFVDCTAAHNLGQALRDNAIKTQLVVTVSHELRTPLNAIVGSLELLNSCASAESQEAIQVARDACSIMTYNINDLTVPAPRHPLGLWQTQ